MVQRRQSRYTIGVETITSLAGKTYRHFMHDSLYRNSIYLMFATAVVAGFGFFFWLFAAHLFATKDVGLATTLISSMSLISILSLMGFDATFIRYLPSSKQKGREMNTGITSVFLFACVLAIGFIIFLPHLASQLLFVRKSIWTILAFVVFCGLAALNVLTDAFFMANRQAKYTLVINIIFSVTKLVFIFLFAGHGPMGIFIAAGSAQLAGTALSIAAMMWKFGYKPAPQISLAVLKQVRSYSSATYAAGLFNLLPAAVLPLIVLNKLGAQKAAYFYIVFTFSSLLYAIPYAASRSMFAEGSHNERQLPVHLKKATRLIFALMLPGIIGIILFGPFILSLFGHGYKTGGISLLRIMAVSGIFVAAYSLLGSFFRITKHLKALIVVNAFYSLAIVGLSYTLISHGLAGVGLAWLVGNMLASLLFFLYLPSRKLGLSS